MSCITSFHSIHNFLLSYNIYCFHFGIVDHLCIKLYSIIIPFSFAFIGIIHFIIYVLSTFLLLRNYHIVLHDFNFFNQLSIIFYFIQNMLTLSLEYDILPH